MQTRLVEVNYLPLQYCCPREDNADPFEKEPLINIAAIPFITFGTERQPIFLRPLSGLHSSTIAVSTAAEKPCPRAFGIGLGRRGAPITKT